MSVSGPFVKVNESVFGSLDAFGGGGAKERESITSSSKGCVDLLMFLISDLCSY